MKEKIGETEIIHFLSSLLKNERFCFNEFKDFIVKKAKLVELTNESQKALTDLASELIENALSDSREQKCSRGLVEGVFDMTHFGHFNAFRQARKMCDSLVVAINGKEEVIKAKGLAYKSASFI